MERLILQSLIIAIWTRPWVGRVGGALGETGAFNGGVVVYDRVGVVEGQPVLIARCLKYLVHSEFGLLDLGVLIVGYSQVPLITVAVILRPSRFLDLPGVVGCDGSCTCCRGDGRLYHVVLAAVVKVRASCSVMEHLIVITLFLIFTKLVFIHFY